jgi:AcrR family transcriptional regulator
MERKRLESPAPRGRPRSEAAHQAILTAAIALTRELGYDAVTMDGIAARAGVGKATVYRRWSSKEALVAEAIEELVSRLPVSDTGSTEGDLRAMLRDTLSLYEDPATLHLLTGLIAAMARSPLIASAVRGSMIASRRAANLTVLRRGIARGDLDPSLDVELALDLLDGPLLMRALLTGAPLHDQLTRDIVRVALRGMKA